MVLRDEKQEVIEKVSFVSSWRAFASPPPNNRVILCWRDMRLCQYGCARNIIYQLLIGVMELSRRRSPTPPLDNTWETGPERRKTEWAVDSKCPNGMVTKLVLHSLMVPHCCVAEWLCATNEGVLARDGLVSTIYCITFFQTTLPLNKMPTVRRGVIADTDSKNQQYATGATRMLSVVHTLIFLTRTSLNACIGPECHEKFGLKCYTNLDSTVFPHSVYLNWINLKKKNYIIRGWTLGWQKIIYIFF